MRGFKLGGVGGKEYKFKERSEEPKSYRDPNAYAAPGGAYGMAAVLCGCESEAPIGQSSEFEGGLPVSPELGFPENDAWRWITAAEIREYEQPTEANYRLLAEALRRAEDAPAQAGGLATRI